MEPGDRASQSFGLRLLAGCGLLTALAFLQSPGWTVTDTKLDLVVDPGRFLSRALEMWDPVGYLGQVQNQAYGYLFPMGPFFWLGEAVSLPPWVIQRLWWALLLCLAFTGFVALARALRIGGLTTALIGGFVYALSPRILTVIGPSSIEVWPMALAPWVLVPLVLGMREGSARRAAVLSALAVACVGGVNAAATFAVIPLAGLWILMNKGPRRTTMLVWWPPLVLLGTLWWIGPLFLLGRYSPPFLDFIESASVTTRLASIDGALRGVTNWVPIVSGQARAGVVYFTEPVVIANAGLIVVAGLIGLTLRGLPARRFLVVGLFLGLVMVTLGHTGPVSGLWGRDLQELLDGVLAPLRNTHKFDLLIRIPVTLGFVHALHVAARRMADRPQRLGLGLALGSVLVGATFPAWADRLATRGTFDDIPQYWQDTTAWVSDNATPGRGALLLPSSAFPDYLWGSTGDEPIQPLSTGSWILRNSIPLTPAGTIRALDAISDSVSSGRADPSLANNLARSGVGYVVIRNDLQVQVSEGRNAVARETLMRSPGVQLVASFGPKVGGSGVAVIDGQRSYARGGWASKAPAVEIFRVNTRAINRVRPTTVVGSAADVLGLRTWGVLSGDAVLASDQGDQPVRDLVLTDGLRKQEAAFGAVDRVRSATRLPGQDWSLDRPVHDYLGEGQSDWLTTATLTGVSGVRASSSRADASSLQLRRTDSSPWAAFDDSLLTAWRADGKRGWIEFDLDRARAVADVTLRGGLPPGRVQQALVVIDGERQEVTLAGNDPVVVPLGLVKSVRIEVSRASGDAQLSDVQLSGAGIERRLELPMTPEEWSDPDEVVLGLGAVRRPGCVEFDDALRCRAGQEDLSEDAGGISRGFALQDRQSWQLTATMRAVASEGFERLAQRGRAVQVSTSSNATTDPGASSVQMLDGSSGTGWTADPQDTEPTIRVRWRRPVEVAELELTTPISQPASKVERVIVRAGDVRFSAAVENGRVVFPRPITSSELLISLVSAEDARDYRSDGTFGTLPVGVAELTIGEALPRLDTDEPVEMTCETDSPLVVNDARIPMRGATTLAALLRGEAFTISSCDPVQTLAGRQRVDFSPMASVVPESVRLSRASTRAEAGFSLDVRRSNFNAAWTDAGGAPPAVVNGWQQGFWTPNHAQPQYAASGTYTLALRIGAGAAGLLLLIMVVVGSRRRLVAGRSWAPRWFVAVALATAAVTFAGIGGTVAALAGFTIASLPRAWAPAAVVAAAMSGSLAVTIADGEIVSAGASQLLAAVALGAVARAAFARR
ncbi:alpha-(1-_3)-arabinofuranosyltransferase family protein [Aeromicrobium sp.]|uniref:alpha-(1->3)-arabinofuranosyltransferase domain-containing protein n=1 Tax=Aeromicrobium sp. TaxID=1871063 RepID=UPI0028AB7668|nr:alpha-(1->3)-arabinofuranosyltransferase family protein [Aeromicrobium sp.]